MKYLIMCEGPNELEVIKILLEHDCLKITTDDSPPPIWFYFGSKNSKDHMDRLDFKQKYRAN